MINAMGTPACTFKQLWDNVVTAASQNHSSAEDRTRRELVGKWMLKQNFLWDPRTVVLETKKSCFCKKIQEQPT